MTFMVKCHNEERFIGDSLESLRGITIDHEIVVVLHRCTDRSKDIVLEKQQSGLPILIHEIEEPISLPGYQTLVTPDDHPNSLISYYNRCLSLCNKHWTFKWDADFFCDENMRQWINNLPERSEDPTCYYIGCEVNFKDVNEEFYLTNCLMGHRKQVFWEAPIWSKNAIKKTVKDFVIQSIDSSEVKPYWRKDPWFIGKDKILEDTFNKLNKMMGEESPGMSRASHDEWTNEYYMNFINKEEDLMNIGANLWG